MMQVSKKLKPWKHDEHPKNGWNTTIRRAHLTAGITLYLLKGENAAKRVRIIEVKKLHHDNGPDEK